MRSLYLAAILSLAALLFATPALAQQPPSGPPTKSLDDLVSEEWASVLAADTSAASAHRHFSQLVGAILRDYKVLGDKASAAAASDAWWHRCIEDLGCAALVRSGIEAK